MGASLLSKCALMCSVLISSWMHIISAAVITDKFSSPNDYKGWNCGKITTCGKFGSICGGFGVKGKGSDIKKTFNVPAGTYSVTLNFIKIDSWYVRMSGVLCCFVRVFVTVIFLFSFEWLVEVECA